MEREEIERLKEAFKPVQERGRRMFGKDVFDEHIKDLLRYFEYDPENDVLVKEIFNI
jgi:hypothetical protein